MPIHKDFRKYLGFDWNGQYYTWNILPYGLNVSPFYFCKTLRPAIQYLRQKGVRLMAFMDDILLCSQEKDIQHDVQLCIDTLQSLGWQINPDKSSLVPETQKEYLGYILNACDDSGLPSISIPSRRILKVKKDIRRAFSKPSVKAHILARLGGQCISMCKAVFPGKLKLRAVYRLLKTRTCWSDNLTWSKDTVQDLKWWTVALDS